MFGSAVALCGASLFVGAPHGSNSPGRVQYQHVSSDTGAAAFSSEDKSILAQCVRCRTGVSLPQNVFDRAVGRVFKDAAAPWPLAKVLMVGEGRAGKTALRNALVGKHFAPTDSTIGIETLSVGRLAIAGSGQGRWVEGLESEFEGYDSEMRARAIAKVCVQDLHKNSQAIVPMQRKSMAELMRERMVNAGTWQQPSDAGTSLLLAGSSRQEPHDTSTRALQPASMMRRVEELMRTLDEEREDMAIELWDFGGQEIFYILYHLFLSEFGTYLLTFSMERLVPSALPSDRERCLSMIRYWLDNIALHTGALYISLVYKRMHRAYPPHFSLSPSRLYIYT